MTIKNISGFYRVFRVFLAVLEPFLLALKGFEKLIFQNSETYILCGIFGRARPRGLILVSCRHD